LFLGIAALVPIFSSCDKLNSDSDLIKPTTNVKNTQVYARSNSSILIDLTSKIETNQTLTLSVTSQTRKGNLTNLGKGLLQYSPSQGTSRDAFNFVLYNQKNELVKEDSVVILIESDSTQLPCGIYPSDDYVYWTSKDSNLWIDVLANDILCGLDTTNIELTIYQPYSDFHYPVFGTAQVIDGRIRYTPGSTFAGYDKFLYKIQSKKDAKLFALGYVSIQSNTSAPCQFSLMDDYFGFVADTSTPNGVWLSVFGNDSLCDTVSTNYQYSFTKAPFNGTATIDKYGIFYVPTNLSQVNYLSDTLKYEVCYNQVCLGAKVVIVIKK
jgi:hypothetical protein